MRVFGTSDKLHFDIDRLFCVLCKMLELVLHSYKEGTLRAMAKATLRFDERRGNAPISEECLLHYFEGLA